MGRWVAPLGGMRGWTRDFPARASRLRRLPSDRTVPPPIRAGERRVLRQVPVRGAARSIARGGRGDGRLAAGVRRAGWDGDGRHTDLYRDVTADRAADRL